MEPRGCNRCGGYHQLQVSHIKPLESSDVPEEIRLCLWCRRKGIEESLAAAERISDRDA